MSIKEFAIGIVKVTPLALVKVLWAHAPEIIHLCSLIYAIGLAVQTCRHFWRWLQGKIAAYRARTAVPRGDRAGEPGARAPAIGEFHRWRGPGMGEVEIPRSKGDRSEVVNERNVKTLTRTIWGEGRV